MPIRVRSGVAVMVVLSSLCVACGTRRSHEEVRAAAAVRGGSQVAADDGTGSGEDEAAVGEAMPASGPAKDAENERASDVDAGPLDDGVVAPSGTRSAGPNEPKVQPRGGLTLGSPIRLGSVGTQSGPAGAVLNTLVQGIQAWAKDVNGRGGVNGHRVQIIHADDGADPARHRASTQRLVEQDHVLAFIQNNEPLTGKTSVAYNTAKRIPVIGSETGGQWFYESPMYFPQASSGDNLAKLTMAGGAAQARARGKSKVGILTCTEAQVCNDSDRIFPDVARQGGMTTVYRGKASLAQPDFTAECLSARNAGAELLMVILDTASIGRVGAGCARQAYRPILSFGASLIVDRQEEDKNLDGSAATLNVFPYFQAGTPATDEFQRAMKRLLPGVRLGAGHGTAWVTGKLFEKAAANIGEPPTTGAILRGLWSIKNDTLGGLTQPLTFIENRPAPQATCWFNVTINNGAWVSPDRYTLHCR